MCPSHPPSHHLHPNGHILLAHSAKYLVAELKLDQSTHSKKCLWCAFFIVDCRRLQDYHCQLSYWYTIHSGPQNGPIPLLGHLFQQWRGIYGMSMSDRFQEWNVVMMVRIGIGSIQI